MISHQSKKLAGAAVRQGAALLLRGLCFCTRIDNVAPITITKTNAVIENAAPCRTLPHPTHRTNFLEYRYMFPALLLLAFLLGIATGAVAAALIDGAAVWP